LGSRKKKVNVEINWDDDDEDSKINPEKQASEVSTDGFSSFWTM